MIYHALHVSFDRFSLDQIDPRQCFREMEFLYPSSDPIAGVDESKNCFLKGVIDLVFEHEGKYYLVDWKSNWLGPSKEQYQEDQVLQCMEDNQYHLQAAIYREALKKYIGAFDGLDFTSRFGGIFYVFLRGIDPFLNPKNSVVYLP